MEINKIHIYDELIELKDWWVENKNLWFDSNEYDDLMITNKYDKFIKINYDNEILLSKKNFGIGYIILHDQITRHISRAKKYQISFVQTKLRQLVDFVIEFYQIYKNELEGHEFCFCLLPLRHTNQFKNQVFVINETWNKIKNSTLDLHVQIYKNYLKASYKRATNGLTYLNEYIQCDINFKEILDSKCLEYLYQPLNKINDSITNKLEKTCENLKNSNTKYILSLSGGVDSMVLSQILNQLNIDFVMIHINYANRGELCEKEKQLLSQHANIQKIELYMRDIYEIGRIDCMKYDLRNLYEDYTKDVRYKAYVDVAKIKGWDKPDINWSVLLGHNHDDCIENILTNIANKNKYDNLKGMEYETNIKFNDSDIKFVRPLLSIKKEEIYKYAENRKIYYFADSTPKWSQRGKIRDIVRPALIDWNESSLNGFEELSEIMKYSLECVDLLVSRWINELKPINSYLDNQEQISKYELNIFKLNSKILKINILELKINKIFWLRLFVGMNILISSKTLNELLNRLKNFKNSFKNIQIKQMKQIELNKKNKMYFWKLNQNEIIIGFN